MKIHIIIKHLQTLPQKDLNSLLNALQIVKNLIPTSLFLELSLHHIQGFINNELSLKRGY